MRVTVAVVHASCCTMRQSRSAVATAGTPTGPRGARARCRWRRRSASSSSPGCTASRADEAHPSNRTRLRRRHRGPGGGALPRRRRHLLQQRDARQHRHAAADRRAVQRPAAAPSRIPLAISTDQEMGIVTRIGRTRHPVPRQHGAGRGPFTADAEQAARITGSELRAMGINQDFAPVADVNSNPANPVIGVRSASPATPSSQPSWSAPRSRGYRGGQMVRARTR